MNRTITTSCPICANRHSITGDVSHDPGVWRTANGDGWPESWEVNFDPAHCPSYADADNAGERMDEAFIAAYKLEQYP